MVKLWYPQNSNAWLPSAVQQIQENIWIQTVFLRASHSKTHSAWQYQVWRVLMKNLLKNLKLYNGVTGAVRWTMWSLYIQGKVDDGAYPNSNFCQLEHAPSRLVSNNPGWWPRINVNVILQVREKESQMIYMTSHKLQLYWLCSCIIYNIWFGWAGSVGFRRLKFTGASSTLSSNLGKTGIFVTV